MKKNKILLLSVFMLVLVVANVIFAATDSVIDITKTGTLTILTREQSNGSTETTTAPVISGIEYTLYKVGDVGDTTVSTLEQAETAIASLTAVGTQTTGSDGKTIFTNLALGRYYAKVTGYPTGTSKIPDSFLVDIPMTNEAGDAWVYEVVADPKVQTASGAVTLTLKDDEGNVIESGVFKLQISTKSDDTWSDWTDYVPDGSTDIVELTTDTNGQIQMSNIPITYQEKEARYRFYNITDSMAIVDNTDLDYFYITDEGKTVVVHSDATEEVAADVAQLEVIVGTVSLVTTVQRDDGEYASTISAGVSDTIKVRSEIKLPYNVAKLSKFQFRDFKYAGLKNISNLKVIGIKNDTEIILTENEHYTKELAEGKAFINGVQTELFAESVKLTFVPSKISEYDRIVVTYDTALDIENKYFNYGSNYTDVGYPGNVEEDLLRGPVSGIKVYTSGLRILKTDSSANPLAGATFKIAKTKADAEAGNFLKDGDGNDLVGVSGDDGYTGFDGLAFSDDGVDDLTVDNVDAQALEYYLVETQAPTYTEEVDGEEVTKSYKLLKAPLKVTVTAVSNSDDYAVEIVNRKPLELPKTGGIGILLFVVAGIAVMGYSIYKNKKQAKNIEA